jgi:hypothetical protein
MTVTVADGYWARPASHIAMTRRAKSATALRFRTCGRLYVENTRLERLTQHFKPMPRALGELIEEEHTVVGPRHLTRHGDLTAADQPHIGNGLVGGATGPGGDARGAPPGEAGDAMDAGSVEGLGQGQIRKHGGQLPG